jgi:hypothetical protein
MKKTVDPLNSKAVENTAADEGILVSDGCKFLP